MKFLVRPKPYTDESLESYLLRLSDENGFESYQTLAAIVHEWLHKQDHRAAGAFPRELGLVNVYHANRSSGLRVRAIQLFQQLAGSEELPLLKLALMHSSAWFGNRHSAVFRNGVDIPRAFLRKSGIPVCYKCLEDAPYIRQCWHFEPYITCHIHGNELISHCPGCSKVIDYQRVELITCCDCGYDLRYAPVSSATSDGIRLAKALAGELLNDCNPLFSNKSLSHRFGAILWHQRLSKEVRFGESALKFFDHWPESLIESLEAKRLEAESKLVKRLNRTYFSEVFGDLLLESRQLPMRDIGRNFVLRAIVGYFTELARNNPLSKKPNVGDILLNLVEASALLSTDTEVVYRLYQEGYLSLAIRPKGRSALATSSSVFRLRDVVELRLARMQSERDGHDRYLPAW